jgi:hypothetical protein
MNAQAWINDNAIRTTLTTETLAGMLALIENTIKGEGFKELNKCAQ